MLTALTSAVALVVSLAVTPIVRHRRASAGAARRARRRAQDPPVPGAAPGRRGDRDRVRASPSASRRWRPRTSTRSASCARTGRRRSWPGRCLLVVVGIIDDVRGMRAMVKLFWQVAAAVARLRAGAEHRAPRDAVGHGQPAAAGAAADGGVDRGHHQRDQPDRRARRPRHRRRADGARRLRAAVGVGRGRPDAADHRRGRRRRHRLPCLQPPSGLDHHGRHRLDVPRLRGRGGGHLADPGRPRTRSRRSCRSWRSPSR